jgi:plasmid stability protein
MTMTVKLDATLEAQLRERSVALGRSASALIRDALHSYLAQTTPPAPSAFELGRGLFGKYSGPSDLASNRKAVLADIWENKRPRA